MKPGNAPKTIDELRQLVDEAVFEVDDVLRCAEDEGEGDLHFSRLIPVAQTLKDGLARLRNDLASGELVPGTGKDLLFIPLFRQWREHFPFALLVEDINRTCREGF